MRKALFALTLLVLTLAPRLAAQAKPDVPPEPKVKVGDIAPDFRLKDQTGKDVALHDFKGKKNVVLAFYVLAFTAG